MSVLAQLREYLGRHDFAFVFFDCHHSQYVIPSFTFDCVDEVVQGFRLVVDPDNFEEERLSDQEERLRYAAEGREGTLASLVLFEVLGKSRGNGVADDLSKEFGRKRGD